MHFGLSIPVVDTNAPGTVAVAHEITSPRDAASGQATGKRNHQPIRIRLYL